MLEEGIQMPLKRLWILFLWTLISRISGSLGSQMLESIRVILLQENRLRKQQCAEAIREESQRIR